MVDAINVYITCCHKHKPPVHECHLVPLYSREGSHLYQRYLQNSTPHTKTDKRGGKKSPGLCWYCPSLLLSGVTACCNGHLVILVDRSHQRGWRWSCAIPVILLIHTAANWPSPTWLPMTQDATAVTTPKMVWTTAPPPMSLSEVRPAKCSDPCR